MGKRMRKVEVGGEEDTGAVADENDGGLGFPGVESEEEPWEDLAADCGDEDADIRGLPEGKGKGKKKVNEGSFQALGIDFEVRRALLKHGYRFPTPIQRRVMPEILSGRDVVAMARTGSGKTCAFLAPLLTMLKRGANGAPSSTDEDGVLPRGLVVSPTRELALQTHKFFRTYGRGSGLKACVIVGGGSIEKQFAALARRPDVIIATPGRMLQVLDEMKRYSLRAVEIAVFDEADRLFEGTLATEVRDLIKAMGGDKETGVHVKRQSVLISATMPSSLAEFSRAGLRPDPAFVRLDVEKMASSTLATAFYVVKPDYKDAALLFILRNQILTTETSNVVIFTATRHHVDYIAMLLERAKIGVGVAAVHGHMDQVARQTAVASFRGRRSRVLVVTDVAARGIDIPVLDAMINFDFPPSPKLFVHRVGRVARAGRTGVAYSLVTPEEMPYMVDTFVFQGYGLATERNSSSGEHPATRAAEIQHRLETSFCVGRLPPGPLEDEEEWIRAQLALRDDLSGQMRSRKNAQGLYNRTRPKPSSLSVQKVKELVTGGQDQLPVHLWMRDTEFQTAVDHTHEAASKNLSQWRPKESQVEAGSSMRSKVKERREQVAAAQLGDGDEDDEQMTAANFSHARNILAKPENSSAAKKSSRRQKLEEEKGSFFLPTQLGSADKTLRERGLKLNSDLGDKIEDAVVDFAGEDADDVRKRKQGKVWDRKRKKFVGADSVDDNGKRVKRNESGQRVRMDKQKSGELYEKWLKKSRGEGTAQPGAKKGGSRGSKTGAHGRKSRDETKNMAQIRKARSKRTEVAEKMSSKKRRQEEMSRGGAAGTMRPSKRDKGKAWSRSRAVPRR